MLQYVHQQAANFDCVCSSALGGKSSGFLIRALSLNTAACCCWEQHRDLCEGTGAVKLWVIQTKQLGERHYNAVQT